MISSDQIRAARALLRLDQTDVAHRAGVSLATLRRAEGAGDAAQVSFHVVESVRHVLEEAGAEFIHNGVRRRTRRNTEEIRQRVAAIMEIAHRSAQLQAQYPDRFSEDDLYDENGLPA